MSWGLISLFVQIKTHHSKRQRLLWYVEQGITWVDCKTKRYPASRGCSRRVRDCVCGQDISRLQKRPRWCDSFGNFTEYLYEASTLAEQFHIRRHGDTGETVLLLRCKWFLYTVELCSRQGTKLQENQSTSICCTIPTRTTLTFFHSFFAICNRNTQCFWIPGQAWIFCAQ